MRQTKIKVGNIYGRWKVLAINVINPESKAKIPYKCAYCECICERKIKKYIRYQNLLNGTSLSCGCLKSEKLSQRNKNNSSVKIGNIYGNLEVIEDLGYRKQYRGKNESWYKCLCHNCGNNNYECNGNNLQSGAITSCGCVSSRGEEQIKNILIKNNINFVSQYSFEDLNSDNGYALKFDFAILKENKISYLIEFDGRQHIFGPDAKWTQSDSLETIKRRDELKNQYCIKNNLILIRIPYTKLNNIKIEDLKIETSSFIV